MNEEKLAIVMEVEDEIKEELASGYKKPAGKLLSREEVLVRLSEAISVVYYKSITGRIRDTDKDELRLKWLKAQGYLAGVFLSGLKDLNYDKLSERITKIERERDELIFETQRQKARLEEFKEQIERPGLNRLKEIKKENEDIIMNTIR